MSKTDFTALFGSTNGVGILGDMPAFVHQIVALVHELRDVSKMIGAEPICGAVVYTSDARQFGAAGNVDAHPVTTALADARMAGADSVAFIAFSVPDIRVPNPLPKDAVNSLLEFGDVAVLLVGDDCSVETTLASELRN